MANTQVAERQSRRKRLISEFLHREPYALLDELRWHVLRREAMESGRSLSVIERSHLVSFSRTVRDHCSELDLHRFAILDSTYVGLVARCGVYRIRAVNDVLRFLNAVDPSILCSFNTKIHFEAPRYTERFVTPCHHAVTVRLFEQPQPGRHANSEPCAFVPATSRQWITVVAPRGQSIRQETLAQVAWKLFGRGPKSTDPWFAVRPLDPLSSVLV
jgi:hypothetical protein